MTTKEYLNQVYKIDRRINITIAKIEKLRASLYGRSCQSDNTGGHHSCEDTLSKAVCKIIEYEQKADTLIDTLVNKRLEIEQAILSVDDDVQQEILERRYLLFQRWDSYYDKNQEKYIKGIADDMGYSRRQIFRLHGIALKKIKMAPDVSECHL